MAKLIDDVIVELLIDTLEELIDFTYCTYPSEDRLESVRQMATDILGNLRTLENVTNGNN